MKFRLSLLLFLVLFVIIDEIGAKRTSSGRSRSSSSSRGSYGGSRGSSYGGSRGSSYGGGSTSHSGSSHGSSSSGTSHGTSTSYGGSHSTPYGSSHGTSYGTSHGSASPGHGTSPSQGQTSHQHSKDATTSFLNAEGGGAPRPASTPGNNNPHAPSAPLYPHGPVSPAKPPYPGSAPPLEHIPKTTSGTTQSQAPTTFGQPSAPHNPSQPYPPWGNPHMNPNNPAAPGLPSSNIGFKDHLLTPSTHGSNPPYPVNGPNHPYPMSGSNSPYPMHSSNSPYPVPHGSNPPYPVQHGSNPPYPMGGPSYGQPGYPSGGPGFIPGPTSHYNSFGQPNAPALGNPYATNYHTGSAFNAPGQPQYAPQVLSQPAAQPFVPGQTVLMVPGQQDSGRGLGQIFKEALVFSTVNAAVNRVINPHHHYVSESRPADSGGSAGSAGGAPTTHITYNNQYFNTYPGMNGTVDGSQQGGPVPFPNSPMPGVAGIPTIPGAPGAASFSGGSGAAGTVASAGIPGASITGSPSPNGQGTQGTQANATNTSMGYTPQYRVSDDELLKISEELFSKQSFDLSKFVTVNLQNRSTSQFPNITDAAAEPLFMIQPELLDYPSISVTRALYDNYEFDSRKKEDRTIHDRKEENLLIDTFLETNAMSRAMQWLAEHSFIDPDDFEKKDTIRRVWFNQFDGTTSGFERVFTAEKYGDTDILGVQDWLYFEHQEAKKRIDYMGYVDKLDLGNSSSLIKLNFQMDGIIRPNATIFVGTLPELEMSLYTICFYARPNNLCPVSLGGAKFNIFTHSFRYFGSDLIDLGLPIF